MVVVGIRMVLAVQSKQVRVHAYRRRVFVRCKFFFFPLEAGAISKRGGGGGLENVVVVVVEGGGGGRNQISGKEHQRSNGGVWPAATRCMSIYPFKKSRIVSTTHR